MARKVLGLDIRKEAVTAALVKSGLRRNSIEAYLRVPVEKTDEGLHNALKALTESMDIHGSECVSSIPAEFVSFRNIQVPFRNLKKIRQILPFEMEPTLPVPVDTQAIDFQRVDSTDNGGPSLLLSAAVAMDRMDGYLQALSAFKINPERVTIAGYPTAAFIARDVDFPENGLVLDVDSDRSTLFVIASRCIALIRSITLTLNDASGVQHLCREIRWTLGAFTDRFQPEYHPQGMMITGSRQIPRLAISSMSEQLGFPVKVSNDRAGEGLRAQRQPAVLAEEASFDNAVSLALMEIKGIDGFDFRKRSQAGKGFWTEYGKQFVRTGILAVFLIILAFFNVFYQTYTLRKEVSLLDKEITDIFKSTFPEVTKIVDPVHQMRLEINSAKKAALMPGSPGDDKRIIDLFNDISKLIPETIDVEFTRMVIGPENVMISGNTSTFNAVDDMKSRLEKADLFEKVTINSANIDRADNRVRFNLKLDL